MQSRYFLSMSGGLRLRLLDDISTESHKSSTLAEWRDFDRRLYFAILCLKRVRLSNGCLLQRHGVEPHVNRLDDGNFLVLFEERGKALTMKLSDGQMGVEVGLVYRLPTDIGVAHESSCGCVELPLWVRDYGMSSTLWRAYGIACKLVTLQWYCREKLGLRRQLKLQRSRATKHPNRIETTPGEEIQIDFGEKDISIGGRTIRLHFFVGVLGYSRRIFVKFFTCENQEAWLAGLEGAFMYFQGIPHKVICDNARALICNVKRPGEAPVYTKAFAAFCRYWGIRPVACQPYMPQEKGKVERCVRYVKENFLSGIRLFTSIQDVQEQFGEWESKRAAKRIIHSPDGMQFSPEQRFAEEKETLRPILKASIADYRVEERKVSASNCISVSNVLFKLSEDLRNLTVDVLIGREKIIVSHEGRTIAKLDRQADAYKSMIRPEEPVLQACARRVSLPGSPFDRPIANYEEAAQC